MTLNKIPSWKDVESCLEYLIGKGVDVDDATCFDQTCNLKAVCGKLPTGRRIRRINCQRIRNGANILISLRTLHATQKF